MIRIGVAEDDPAARALLLGYLDRYAAEHDQQFDVATFPDGEALLTRYRPDVDILLLDIEMPKLDGFSVAQRIRAIDQHVVIVFITNMTKYAIRGYEVEALSYLLKPVPYFAFSQQLKRSIERIQGRSTDYLSFTAGGELVRVDTSQILYIESIKHRVVVHAIGAQYSFTGALRNLEVELEGRGFYRSNNCYLVNLRHVTSVTPTSAVLLGGHDLVVSRPRRKGFLAALTDHLGGRHG